jgi:glycosyltransferase involved in cell wall biosynthesis
MKLSVIITNYNYARFVEAAISSALNIDYEPKEIVVVDDGSTDGSQKIISALANRHPEVVPIFKSNGGQVDALNVGFMASDGDIIYTLDADDEVLPDMMTRVLTKWGPGVSRGQFMMRIIDSNSVSTGRLHQRLPLDLDPQTVRNELLRTASYPWAPTSGTVYSRSFLTTVLPLEIGKYRYFDLPLATLAPLYGDVVTLSEVLALYRVHGNNGVLRANLEPKIHQDILKDMMPRDRLLEEHCSALGIRLDPHPNDNDIHFNKNRLISLRLLRKTHPITSDRAIVVTWKGVKAAVSASLMSRRRRAFVVMWFLMMGLAPGPLAKSVAMMLYPVPRIRRLAVAMRAWKV